MSYLAQLGTVCKKFRELHPVTNNMLELCSTSQLRVLISQPCPNTRNNRSHLLVYPQRRTSVLLRWLDIFPQQVAGLLTPLQQE